MNYILEKINQRIDMLEMQDSNLSVHYQSRIEYILIFILGYLWNKNYDKLDEDVKIQVFNDIICPSIGTIVSACRTLDLEKEIFGEKKLRQAIDMYPSIRNLVLGHGFTFEDSMDNVVEQLKSLYNDIINIPSSFVSKDFNTILVTKFDGEIYKGINFKSKGGNTNIWNCSSKAASFEVGNIYI